MKQEILNELRDFLEHVFMRFRCTTTAYSLYGVLIGCVIITCVCRALALQSRFQYPGCGRDPRQVDLETNRTTPVSAGRDHPSQLTDSAR